jgi:hypothetical protein
MPPHLGRLMHTPPTSFWANREGLGWRKSTSTNTQWRAVLFLPLLDGESGEIWICPREARPEPSRLVASAHR